MISVIKQPVVSIVLSCLFLVACSNTHTAKQTALKINDIQVIGSHNSYKRSIEPNLLKIMQKKFDRSFAEIQYQHPSITTQLEQFGLRNLEIDILHDPVGGMYSSPLGNKWLEDNSYVAVEHDNKNELSKPGFKVLHMPDLDFRSSCLTLKSCLEEIKNWSNRNPKHLPVAITFNAKSDNFQQPGFTQPLSFTSSVFDLLDKEILSVLPIEKLVRPDDVRANYESLSDAVTAQGWPSLADSRGKFILVLDESDHKREAYITGHPSLKNRIMFVNAKPDSPESAFIIMNDPIKSFNQIQTLVKKGYLVRTRADSATKEARNNDYRRFNAALASGAQFITTDYYEADKDIKTEYKISLPNNQFSRCNPVNQKRGCNLKK